MPNNSDAYLRYSDFTSTLGDVPTQLRAVPSSFFVDVSPFSQDEPETIQPNTPEPIHIPDTINSIKDLEDVLQLVYRGIVPEDKFLELERLYKAKVILEKEKRIADAKANGIKLVELSDRYYKKGELESIRECVKIREGYIRKADSICTLENEYFHGKNVPNNLRFCEDVDKWSRLFYIVKYPGANKTVSKIDKKNIIFYRREWYDKKYAVRCGLVCCEDCGEWYNESVCRCKNDCLDGYHSGHGGDYFVLGAEDAPLKVGIELEKATTLSGRSHLTMKKNKWRCETDSTVSAEYITPVMPLDDIEQVINFIEDTGAGVLTAQVNSRCGGHMHVSVAGESTEDTYERLKGWRPLLWALYPDRISGYSSINADKYDHSVDVGIRNRTVEIRIFPGLDSQRKLRFRLELVKYMLKHPKKQLKSALMAIINDTNLQSILEIAYGNNTRRLNDFITRLKEFYKADTTELNEHVARLAKRMIADKNIDKTVEQIETHAREVVEA